MSNNINLLPSKKKSNQFEDKLLKKGKQISIIFLVITAISSALVFLFSFDSSLSRITQQKNNTLTNLSFTHGKVAKYLLIKDRLDSISTIIQNRSSYDTIIAAIKQQLPDDVVVESLTINDKILTMSVSSSSLSSLDTFLTNTTQLFNDKKILKTMTIDSVGSDDSLGKYVLSMKSDLL